MMSVDKTSTSKTEQIKQERLGEEIGLHTSNMVVMLTNVSDRVCEE